MDAEPRAVSPQGEGSGDQIEEIKGRGGAGQSMGGHSAAEPYLRPGRSEPVPSVLFADVVVITNWLPGQSSVSQALPSRLGEARGMASLKSGSRRFVLSPQVSVWVAVSTGTF